MIMPFILNFLPELVLLIGGLGLSDRAGRSAAELARTVALLVACHLGAAAVSLRQQADLFSGAYRVDQFRRS